MENEYHGDDFLVWGAAYGAESDAELQVIVGHGVGDQLRRV